MTLLQVLCFPNAPVLVEKAVPGKMRFVGESNVSNTDIAGIQLSQRDVRDRRACVYGRWTRALYCQFATLDAVHRLNYDAG